MDAEQQALLEHVENIKKNDATINDLLPILSLLDFNKVCEFTKKEIANLDKESTKSVYYKGLSILDVLPLDVIQHILSFDDAFSNTCDVSISFKELCHKNVQNQIKNEIDGIIANHPLNNIHTMMIRDYFEDIYDEINDGDKIEINDGIYWLNLDDFDFNKNLSLQGIGNNVIVFVESETMEIKTYNDANDWDDFNEYRHSGWIINKQLYLKNIELHFKSDIPYLKVKENGMLIMENCTIYDDDDFLNIKVCDGGSLIVRNCKFCGTYGISVYDATKIYVINCTFTDCQSEELWGLIEVWDECERSITLVILNNKLTNPPLVWKDNRKIHVDKYILRGNEFDKLQFRGHWTESMRMDPNIIHE